MWAEKKKCQTYLQNHFHGKPLNIFAKYLELFLLQNECFFNAYLICLRCTWGSTIRGQFSQGEQPRMERYLCHWWQRGRDLSDAEDRGRFIICRGQRHGSRESMSDMISVLHQSVVINAKGVDCWLRLVVIDVNPWRKPCSTKFWVMDPRLFDVKMTHYCLVMVVQMNELQSVPLMVKALTGRRFVVNSKGHGCTNGWTPKWSPYGEIHHGKTLCGEIQSGPLMVKSLTGRRFVVELS